MRESGDYRGDDSGVVFGQEAKEESYKRYKHLCYRNLAIEAALSFVLGLLLAFLFKL